nr:MAG: hypothetical protein [Lokiarchaeota virus Ratatoskr Meg22_1012]
MEEAVKRVKCPLCKNEYFSKRKVGTILNLIYNHNDPELFDVKFIWTCEKCKREWLLEEIAIVDKK